MQMSTVLKAPLSQSILPSTPAFVRKGTISDNVRVVHSCLKHFEKHDCEIAHDCKKNNCICKNMSSPTFRPDPWDWHVVPMKVKKDRQSVKKELDSQSNCKPDEGFLYYIPVR